MRKLALLFMSAFFLSLSAENVIIQDFESGFSGKWGTNGDQGSHNPTENHELFSIVDNPTKDKDEINKSAKVGKLHRPVGAAWWSLAWFEFPSITVEATMTKPKYLHISVYKPMASTVCVQLKDAMEEPVNNTGELKNDKQDKTNAWQDLVFKLTKSGTYTLMEVKPDFVDNGPVATPVDIYFDNIFISEDPTPTGEDPVPLPEFKGDLPEGFEGANTLLDPYFYEERFGTFGQPGEATDLTVVDNPAQVGINTTSKCAKFVRKLTGQWWAGAFMMPLTPMTVDAENKYFHVMVYQEGEPTSLSLKLENEEGNTGDIVLPGNASGIYDWVDYVFEVPEDKFGTYTKIAFMPDFVESPAPGDRYFEDALFYFDALELNDDPEPRTSAEVGSLNKQVSLEMSLKAWKDADGNIQVQLPAVAEGGLIEVFTATGHLLSREQFAAGESIHTLASPAASGMYLIRCTEDGNHTTYLAKILF